MLSYPFRGSPKLLGCYGEPHRVAVTVSLILLTTVLLACSSPWDPRLEPPTEFIQSGQRPIYAEAGAEEIVAYPPKPILQAGSIVDSGTRLYVVDYGTGVHIFGKEDSSASTPISFVQILGVASISVEGEYLFASAFSDLVTIDVSDPSRVRELDRDSGFFGEVPKFPQGYSEYFECYDPSRGALLGWETFPLQNPQCKI